MGTMWILLTGGLLILLIVGVWMIRTGWRGKRVGDHPVCKRCGFDLVGLYQPSRNTRQKCPECGAGLTPKAVAIGIRVRRRRWIASGTLVLIVFVTSVLLVGVRVYRGGAWYPYMPTAALRELLWIKDHREDAERVLVARLQAGDITQTQSRAIVDEIIHILQQGKREYEIVVNEFVDEAIIRGDASEAQIDAYFSEALSQVFDLRTRPEIMPGDPVAWHFTIPGGLANRFHARVSFLPKEQTARLRVGDITHELTVVQNKGGSSGYAEVSSRVLDGVESATLCIEQTQDIVRRPEWNEQIHIATVTSKHETTIDVGPDRGVNVLEDPDALNQLKTCIRVSVRHYDEGVLRNNQQRHALLTVTLGELPRDFAFEAFVRVGDETLVPEPAEAAQRAAFPGSRTDHILMRYTDEHDLDLLLHACSVDVVLRSSVQTALKYAWVDEICAGDIVFEQVPVQKRTRNQD